MLFCVYNKGKVEISEQDYKNVIVIFWKIINNEQRQMVGHGALISSEWVLITHECFNFLNPFEHMTAAVGSELSEITFVGYQEVLSDKKFYILIVSSFTVYCTI